MRPGEGYLSPSLARLERPPRRGSPARLIATPQPGPTVAPDDPRLDELEQRVALLEERQLELAANLGQAHEAFRRLAQRVLVLSDQPEPPRQPSEPA